MKTCRRIEHVVREIDPPDRKGFFCSAQLGCGMKVLDYAFYDRAVAALIAVTNLDEVGYKTVVLPSKTGHLS